ncbi:hypothetical protein [Citrobacter sp. wls613]|jgi:hypothetical protein|uniref:hypothetical protein n=1 Tax=Citrobacter sp. wls613 TaxID=2576436 RepID=UPI0010CA7EB1|nr:hypothetical protein [Citrobacter sp. wls613]TKV19174.1 hypothetical protein FDX01_15175 [Citrobacter sp. wls613]
MKNLILITVASVVLVGCSNNPNASDYELCQAMSGDTFTSSAEAARMMQDRAQAGTATISSADCIAIAQGTAAGWQQKAANLNAAAQTYNQSIQPKPSTQTTCNPTLGGGFTCNQN